MAPGVDEVCHREPGGLAGNKHRQTEWLWLWLGYRQAHTGGNTPWATAAACGGSRTNFIRIPEDDICIVLLGNTETQALHNITEKLVAVLYDLPYQLPASKTIIKLDTVVLKKYTGTYLLAEKNLKVHIVLENGELAAYPERPRSTALRDKPFYVFFEG